eukprot:TRINITY_DN11498_c0_g1_i3.p1 TRINITY_DN11498_c0_g1~~TRINITY_DN11498_c0_g1_i3.p1  ORF type:complete len:481 (+),score=69.97 TRINITY_DN11498_c0_g1_i3:44-1486(+)
MFVCSGQRMPGSPRSQAKAAAGLDIFRAACSVLDDAPQTHYPKCDNGHEIVRYKEGLKWHQFHFHARTCDSCDCELGRDEPRWKCEEGCNFHYCEQCFKDIATKLLREALACPSTDLLQAAITVAQEAGIGKGIGSSPELASAIKALRSSRIKPVLKDARKAVESRDPSRIAKACDQLRIMRSEIKYWSEDEHAERLDILEAAIRVCMELNCHKVLRQVCDEERALGEKGDALEDAQVLLFKSSTWPSSIRKFLAENAEKYAPPPPRPVQAIPVFEIAAFLQGLQRQHEFPIDDMLDSSKALFCEELRDLTLCMGQAMQVQCEAAGRQGALKHYQFLHKVFEKTPQFALSQWWSTNRKVAVAPGRAASEGYWIVKEVYDCIYALEDGIDRNACYTHLSPHHQGLDFLLPLLVPELAHKDTRHWKDLKGYSNGIITAAEAVAKVGQEQADNRAMQLRLEQEWNTEQARLRSQHERLILRMM